MTKLPTKRESLPSRTRKVNPSQSSPPSSATSATTTPDQTPKKSRQKGSSKQSPSESKTRTLYSFFNAATQKQQERSKTVENTQVITENQDEDIIKDDSSDDSIATSRENSLNPAKLVPQKRSFHNQTQPAIIAGSNKFLKKLDGSKTIVKEPDIETDPRPWNERYGPTDLGEVVVHKKKVSDVRIWLESAFSRQRHFRLLVLKGPAGSGKTTTLTALCKSLNLSIKEWRNPTSIDYLSDSSLSVSSQFEEFLGRGSLYGGLEIVSDAAPNGQSSSRPQETKSDITNERQALLVEEFPNNLTRLSKPLQSFRSTILQFLEARRDRTTPLVMIISEAVVSDSNSSVENFTAHRILGPDILHHPNTTVLEFNPVASTFIQKALKLVLQKRRRDVGAQYEPSEPVLKRLAEFGDVRNAVSTLEFVCSQRLNNDTSGARAKVTKKSKSTAFETAVQDSKNTSASSQDLTLIALRESTIGLFHAVGKVMYNKRTALSDIVDSSGNGVEYFIPTHMSGMAKSLSSEVNPDSLIDEIGTEVSTFLSALHENYPLSCYSLSGNNEVTLESIIGCIDSLADADILINSQSNFTYASGISGFRQAELAFHTSVRGILHHLPYPVKRQAPPGKGKADAFRMFYPTSLKLWSKKEEMRESIDNLVDRAIRESLNINPSRSFSITGNPLFENGESPGNSTPSRTIVGSGHSARCEMLMERLPYMVQILETRSNESSNRLLDQMAKLTKFTGVGVSQNEEEESDDLPISKSISSNTTGPTKQQKSLSTLFNSKPQLRKGASEDLDLEEKLVLSDDDIEDDWP